MSDIKKGYTFTDKSTDWASNKETSIRLNKMMDEAKVNLVAGTNVTITPTLNGPQIDVTGAGTGSVTSIDVNGGTGISVSPAGPITTAGTFTVTNTAPDQVVALTGAGTTAISGTYPSFTVTSNDAYVGTVTSVSGAGGGTGLTLSGGPITGSGTLTLGGTLAVANGGTGLTALGSAGQVLRVNAGTTALEYASVSTGGVTSVTGTAPVISSGGATPAISMAAATSSVDGYLTSSNWTTFNNKQAAITLTTTGTSGAATFISNTLNIPQYSGGGGSGTVTNVSVVTANGVSGSVADPTGNAAITLTLGDISAASSKPSGGTARSLESRDGDVFNVRDYGAVGDGSTNDRTAIANADSAANSARGTLYFPRGTYYIGSSITLSSSVQFNGGAITIASGATVTFNQAVVAPVHRIFYGSGVVRMGFRGAKCPVEWWGAGTGTESVQVDDTAYIQAAFDSCRNYGGDIFAEVVFSRQYWLSDEVVVNSNIGISTNSASAVMSKTTSGTGKGLRLQGSFDTNRTWTLPNFSGFTVFAVKVDKVSTARIYIGLISGGGHTGDGIALGCNTLGAATLDNIFHVNFISGCKSAIRIYCNVNSVSGSLATIEGNEFNVNFVNDNVNGVVFDSLDDYTLPVSAYTLGSAWDCNIFNITALDAHAGVRRGFWYRATGLQYSQNVFRVPAWFGGFDSSGIWIDTSSTTKSTFELGVRVGEQMSSYGQFNLRGSGNTVVINGSGNAFGDQLTPDTFTALTSSNRAGFNSGTPVPRNRMKVDFVLPANRAFGDTQTFYVYSPLVDGYSNRLRVSFIDSGGFIVNNLYDNSNSVANEIVVVFQNASGVTRSSGFTISAWVEIAY